MIGANVSIGAGSGRAPGAEEPPAEGDFTVTVGVVSEAPSLYAGYSNGDLIGATGALVGDLLGLVPIFVCTIDSGPGQMQIYIAGDHVAELTGLTIAVNGVPVFVNLSTESGLQFNGTQTVVFRNVAMDPSEQWTNHIGEDFVFAVV